MRTGSLIVLFASLAIMQPVGAEDASSYERGGFGVTPKLTPATLLKAPGSGGKKELPSVTMSVTVKAPPKLVWQAIQFERTADNGKRKLISYDGHDAVIEEKFGTLPIVGAATCTYTEHESIPNKQIDYEIVKSDRFTAFQGKWTLHPTKDGNGTVVELTNALDPGIRVPFWQDITKMAAVKNVKHRLEEVGSYAESLAKEEILKSKKDETLRTSSAPCDLR